MALSDDDLKFVLQPEIDPELIAEGLDRIYASADRGGARAGKALGDSIEEGLSKSFGGEVLKLIQQRVKALTAITSGPRGNPLLEAVLEQERAEQRLKQLEVPEHLLGAHDEQRRLADEAEQRIKLNELLLEQHKRGGAGAPTDQEAAEAAIEKLEAEQKLVESSHRRKQIEEQIAKAAEESAEALRHQARINLESKLAKERQATKRAEALSDPEFVKERVRLEEQITKEREKQAKLLGEEKETPEAKRLAIQKELTEELRRQREELLRQREELDPKILKERLAIERESADLAHRRQVAEAQARLDPQAIQQEVRREKELEVLREQHRRLREQYERKESGRGIEALLSGAKEGGLKGLLRQVLTGVDIPKLIAGTLGAFSGGGAYAGIGAALGGVAAAKNDLPFDVPTAREAPPEVPAPIVEVDLPPTPAPTIVVEAPKESEQESHKNAFPASQGKSIAETAERASPKVLDAAKLPPASPPPAPVPAAAPSTVLTPQAVPQLTEALSGALPQVAGQVAGAAAGGGAAGAIGAGAGVAAEAALGPIGLIVLAAQALAKVGGEVASLPFKGVNAGLRAVDRSLGGMEETLGPVAVGLNLATDLFDGLADKVEEIPIVGDLLGPALQEIAAVPAAIKSITNTLTSMAAKASPAQYRLLEMAVEDAQAVIGHAFLPVMELFTESIRLGGDILATFLPNSEEMGQALAELRRDLRETFTEIRVAAGEAGPHVREAILATVRGVGRIVRALAEAGQQFGPPLSDLLRIGTEIAQLSTSLSQAQLDGAILLLQSSLTLLNIQLRLATFQLNLFLEPLRMLGLITPPTGSTDPRSSQAAAARQAMMSDVEEYQRRLQTEIFSQQQGPTSQQVPAMTQTMMSTLIDIYNLLDAGIGVTILRNLVPQISAIAPPALAPTVGVFTAGNQELLRRLRAALGL